MESSMPEEWYHVVCRECSAERLFDSVEDATTLEREHMAESGHRVVVGRVR